MFSVINNIAKVAAKYSSGCPANFIYNKAGADLFITRLKYIQVEAKEKLSEKCFLYELIQLIKQFFDKGDYALIKHAEDIEALGKFILDPHIFNTVSSHVNAGDNIKIIRGLIFIMEYACKNREDSEILLAAKDIVHYFDDVLLGEQVITIEDNKLHCAYHTLMEKIYLYADKYAEGPINNVSEYPSSLSFDNVSGCSLSRYNVSRPILLE